MLENNNPENWIVSEITMKVERVPSGGARIVAKRQDGDQIIRDVPEFYLSVLSRFEPSIARFLFGG